MNRIALLIPILLNGAADAASARDVAPRYGLIGRMTARPGQRDALAAILLRGSRGMPGCESYVIARDAAAPDDLWIAESWRDKAAHDASLKLPAVRDAIRQGRALIAGIGEYHETQPLDAAGETIR